MTTTEAQPALTPEPILQALQGYQVSAILNTGLELGVFDRIAEGNDDPKSIATAIGADERGTRILLDALAAVGFLSADNGHYILTPVADTFLVSERPAYLGGMMNILGGEWQWEAFMRLGEAVRNGGTVLDEHAETPGHTWWETFARSIGGMATPAAEGLAAILDPWTRDRETLEVLDVACGNGQYALAVGAHNEQARITLLDWPNVLAVTRGEVEKAGMGDRTSYIEGNMFEVPLGGPYDLIITSHVYHHFSEERCTELLERLAGALKPGGRLAIQDFMAGDAPPAEDPFPRLFSVLMLVWTREGEAYPVSAYERMLPAAGFGKPEVFRPPGAPMSFLVAERAG
jgi:SAM-dependent methyltransferase